MTSSPLETLIPHLLASKRSLSSINHVWRANELCTSTRTSLEKSAITTARTSFLRSGIMSQLAVLQQVQRNTETTARQGKAEFQAVVENLDEADKRLRDTLGKLRSTIVEVGLRPEDEERRSLLDFMNEEGVEGLVGVIKESLGGAGQGMKEFEDGNRGFEEEVHIVSRLLHGGESKRRSGVVDTVSQGREEQGQDRSPIPQILHEMEDHAREMAANLESLVSHYDLCVTAIKQTEGGGDAASKIAGDLAEGVDIGQDAGGAPPEPMEDHERLEMMRVLEEDAGQVEDVVMEIRDHIAEMETLHSRVEMYTDQLASEHANTTAAFRMLEDLGQKLPGHITRTQIFLVRWDEEKASIDERLEELEGLTELYDGFLRAYDNLLIEIGRRKVHELKVEQIVQEARTQLERLYEDEVEARDIFKKEQGEFLPVDIWPGLRDRPLRYSISSADDQASRVPDISKSVIYRAIQRVHGKR
ncbi:MAG: autophagy protein 17 [Alectoria sarmentosa]|nr:MAG: autophagy protein 17 [Alectoria sarmentosa]